MASPQQHKNPHAENSATEKKQKVAELRPNAKEITSPYREATEQLLRQVFSRLKESPNQSSEEFTREVGNAFRFFRSEFSADQGPIRNCKRDEKIRERISNLQKRTSDTLKALEKCTENVRSITFLDTNPNQSSDIDEAFISDTRILGELTAEITKIQNRQWSTGSSPSNMTTDRADIRKFCSWFGDADVFYE